MLNYIRIWNPNKERLEHTEDIQYKSGYWLITRDGEVAVYDDTFGNLDTHEFTSIPMFRAPIFDSLGNYIYEGDVMELLDGSLGLVKLDDMGNFLWVELVAGLYAGECDLKYAVENEGAVVLDNMFEFGRAEYQDLLHIPRVDYGARSDYYVKQD